MEKKTHNELMEERNKRVNEAIEEKGYTFAELEKRTGIPHSTLQRYVSGTTDKIPVTFYEAMAEATDKPAEYLLGFDKNLQKESTSIPANRRAVIDNIVNMPDDRFLEMEDRLRFAGYLDNQEEQ